MTDDITLADLDSFLCGMRQKAAEKTDEGYFLKPLILRAPVCAGMSDPFGFHFKKKRLRG